MLERLIASKTRRVLLNTFFSDPEAEYYTRQLASMHKISVGAVHREIRGLLSSGLLKERRVGNIRLFSLNKKNPVYEEMKNIIRKTEGVIRLVKDAVAPVKGIKAAFIYGSYAKGDERPDSDVDIFIIGDDVDEGTLIVRLNALERKLFKEINFTRYTESEYKGQIRKRNSFVLETVKGRKIFIKGGEDDI